MNFFKRLFQKEKQQESQTSGQLIADGWTAATN